MQISEKRYDELLGKEVVYELIKANVLKDNRVTLNFLRTLMNLPRKENENV